MTDRAAEALPEAVGRRMRQLRIVYDGDVYGSPRRFAERIGVSETAWNNYERGYRRPSVKVAVKIVIACQGVTLDWIYLGSTEALDRHVRRLLANGAADGSAVVNG